MVMRYTYALTGTNRKRWLVFALTSVLLAASFAMLLVTLAPSSPTFAANAIIHWDSSMIYAGQNNGNPWGPVGENALVHGENFPSNRQLSILLAPGNSNNGPSVCKSPVATVGNVTTSDAGTFELHFSWPAAAGSVNDTYSICSILASGTGGVASFRDDGPFTVLSSNAPGISVAPASLNPGSSVTVSGQNWVPPQQVSITITGSNQLASATTTSSGLNSGTFSVNISIPSGAQPGSYVVSADTSNNLLHSGTQNINIALAPTPTATATATPTATPTDTPSATDTPNATSTASTSSTGTSNTTPPGPNSSNSGGNGPSALVLGLFLAIALIILVALGLIIYMVLHRSSKQPELPIASANNYMAPFPGMAPDYQAQMQQGNLFNAADQTWQYGMSPPGYAQSMSDQQNQPYTIFEQPTGLMPGTSTNIPICPQCGRRVLANAVRCDGCGMPLQESW
jgi:hypothetical protein